QERTLRASIPRFLRYWVPVRLLPPYVPAAPFAAPFLREWARIRARIDAGRPAVLGLVGDAPDPFGQHQALAFGYARRPGGGEMTVYDPNGPGRTHTISFTIEGRRLHLRTDLRTGRRKDGRAHISTLPGHLSMVFLIDPA
ncbi:MAG: hypothetical protein R3362_05135, partial [Rhodothermales bacterium]|nr:hypothetical protein [Rhodothermales bacterium]